MIAGESPESRYDYTRDDGQRRVTVVAEGRLDIRDLIAIVNRQIDERAWTYGILYDYRQSWEPPTPQEAAILSAYVHQQTRLLGPRGPVALVVAGGPVAEAATAYVRNARVFTARVFGDIDDASRWLDAEQIARAFEGEDDASVES